MTGYTYTKADYLAAADLMLASINKLPKDNHPSIGLCYAVNEAYTSTRNAAEAYTSARNAGRLSTTLQSARALCHLEIRRQLGTMLYLQDWLFRNLHIGSDVFVEINHGPHSRRRQRLLRRLHNTRVLWAQDMAARFRARAKEMK